MRTRTYARALFSTLLVVVALGAACAKKACRYNTTPTPTRGSSAGATDGESAGLIHLRPKKRDRYINLVIHQCDLPEPFAGDRRRCGAGNAARYPRGFDDLLDNGNRTRRFG